MRRALALGLAAGLALAVVGCGASEINNKDDGASVSDGGTTSKGGRIRDVPRPLRLADLRRERQGSAASAVLRLLYFAQWGSAPNIAAAYDPVVRERVGVSNIVGTYSQQRAALATSRVRIVERLDRGTGAFIALDVSRADARSARHSYSLRRRLGRWRVVFDTLLEDGLSTYVASTYSRSAVDQPPDGAAARRGRQAADAYRRLFVSTLDR